MSEKKQTAAAKFMYEAVISQIGNFIRARRIVFEGHGHIREIALDPNMVSNRTH